MGKGYEKEKNMIFSDRKNKNKNKAKNSKN